MAGRSNIRAGRVVSRPDSVYCHCHPGSWPRHPAHPNAGDPIILHSGREPDLETKMWSEINRRMARLTYREIWPACGKDEPKPAGPIIPAVLIEPERRVSPARWSSDPKAKLPADDEELPF